MKIKNQIRIGFIVVMIVLLAIGTLSYQSNQNFRETNHLISLTHEALNEAEHSLTFSTYLETCTRGFVLTENTSFLDPFKKKTNVIAEHLNPIRSLTINDVKQQKNIRIFEQLMNDKIAIMESAVALRKNNHFEEALALISSGKGIKITDQARMVMDEIKEKEWRKIKLMEEKNENAQKNFIFVLAILIALISIILVMEYLILNHDLKIREITKNLMKKSKKEREKAFGKIQEKNNELNTFIYKATHDLRGPLSSIMGLCKLAREETPNNQYFEMIAKSTSKLDDILVLLIETMMVKEKEIVLEKMDFNIIINDILKLLEFSKGFSRIEFRIQVANTEPFFSDKKIIASIFQNLIENAIKYQNYNEPNSFIAIHLFNMAEGIEVKILDNGLGIANDFQDKVFNMFYRANSDSKGSGLGLYIVKSAVEKLSGTIQFKSEPKKGTQFTIHLPNRSAFSTN